LLSSFFLCSFKFLASLWHRFHFETGYESILDENAFLIKLVRIISDLSLLFDEPHRRVLLKVRGIDPYFAVSFVKAKFLHTSFLWYFGQGRYCLSRIETDLARQTLTNPNESHDDGLFASFFVMPPSPLALPPMPKPVSNFEGSVERFDSIPFVTTPRALSILPHLIRPETAEARQSREKFREDILFQGNYAPVVFPFWLPPNRPSDPLKWLPDEELRLLLRQYGTLEKFRMIKGIAANEANLNLMSGFLEWIDVGRQHEHYGESIKSVYDVLLFAYSDLILDLPGRTLASDEILPAIAIEVHKIAENELKFPSLVSVLDGFRMLLNGRLNGILEGFRITEMEQREISNNLLVYHRGEKTAAVQKRLERSARQLNRAFDWGLGRQFCAVLECCVEIKVITEGSSAKVLKSPVFLRYLLAKTSVESFLAVFFLFRRLFGLFQKLAGFVTEGELGGFQFVEKLLENLYQKGATRSKFTQLKSYWPRDASGYAIPPNSVSR
jgi:hypothetical protein